VTAVGPSRKPAAGVCGVENTDWTHEGTLSRGVSRVSMLRRTT